MLGAGSVWRERQLSCGSRLGSARTDFVLFCVHLCVDSGCWPGPDCALCSPESRVRRVGQCAYSCGGAYSAKSYRYFPGISAIW